MNPSPLAAPAEAAPPPAAELEALFEAHARAMLQAAYRVTGNPQDAEDALQTVFIRLLRNDPGDKLRAHPGRYLYRAAIHAAVDVLRRRQSRGEAPLDDARAAVLADRAPDPTDPHDLAELKARIRRALATMHPRTAEIFVLRYFEGYDNHEIARRLGCSRSTVGVVLHRARARLRRLLGGPDARDADDSGERHEPA